MITQPSLLNPAIERPVGESPLRFITAASLFDGHDAAINVMRRLIQDSGAEVVHLGHNRSVRDVVRAAVQEDADAVAISSYQGGHIEYFRYVSICSPSSARRTSACSAAVAARSRRRRSPSCRRMGWSASTTPNDGMELGLTGMIDDLVERAMRWRVPTVVPERAARERRPHDRAHAVRARGRCGQRGAARAPSHELGAPRAWRPGRRHHRHGRRGQEHCDRRAALAVHAELR